MNNINELLVNTPEYTLIKEFDNLSERMLKEFDNDLTIVFDTSVWKYKVISIKNLIATGIAEVYVIPKNMVNDAIIYFLKSFDGNIIRSKYITRYEETQNLYKRAERKRKKEHEIRDHIRRIRRNLGEQVV